MTPLEQAREALTRLLSRTMADPLRKYPGHGGKRITINAVPEDIEIARAALAALSQPTQAQEKDAARWREVERRFGDAKTSACERILEDLRLPVDADGLAPAIDSAIAAAGERG
jgi:hypothetical protein